MVKDMTKKEGNFTATLNCLTKTLTMKKNYFFVRYKIKITI